MNERQRRIAELERMKAAGSGNPQVPMGDIMAQQFGPLDVFMQGMGRTIRKAGETLGLTEPLQPGIEQGYQMAAEDNPIASIVGEAAPLAIPIPGIRAGAIASPVLRTAANYGVQAGAGAGAAALMGGDAEQMGWGAGFGALGYGAGNMAQRIWRGAVGGAKEVRALNQAARREALQEAAELPGETTTRMQAGPSAWERSVQEGAAKEAQLAQLPETLIERQNNALNHPFQLTQAARTGNKTMAQIESMQARNFMTSERYAQIAEGNQAVYAQNFNEAFGFSWDKLDDIALDAQDRAINQRFQGLAQRMGNQALPKDIIDLIYDLSPGTIDDWQAAGALSGYMRRSSGRQTVSPQEFIAIRSWFTKQARSADSIVAQQAISKVDRMDGLLANRPQLQDQYKEARDLYRLHLGLVKGVSTTGAGGEVNIRTLHNNLRKVFPKEYRMGRRQGVADNVNNVLNATKTYATIISRVPDSGTPQGMAFQALQQQPASLARSLTTIPAQWMGAGYEGAPGAIANMLEFMKQAPGQALGTLPGGVTPGAVTAGAVRGTYANQ